MQIAAGLWSVTACFPYQVTPTSKSSNRVTLPIYTDTSKMVQEWILPDMPTYHTANIQSPWVVYSNPERKGNHVFGTGGRAI